ncbi:MAG: hypothetical protein ACXVWU_06960 [Nocardioides sp.]
MKGRTVLLGVLAWAAVVAAGSGVTWLVIDAAGQQVLTDRPVPVAPAPEPHATGPGPTPSARPPRPTPSPSGSPATAPPPSVERAWRGTPGTVVARCSGDAVSLTSATPGDGYGVEVGSRGPGDVEVTFAAGGRRVKVSAVCSAGVPRFSGESEGGDD